MPQMAPLMWMNLYFIFILCFLFFNILNYFNFKYTNDPKNKFLSSKNSSLNLLWKW